MSEVFVAVSRFPTRDYGDFTIHVTRDNNVALTRGDVTGDDVWCRIQSACMPSTALNYDGCPCKQQIDDALDTLAREGRGVLIYLTGQEGRGHGLVVKVRALVNKLAGMDSYRAVEALGLPADVRTYEMVPPMLAGLGVRSVRLVSANAAKHAMVREAVR